MFSYKIMQRSDETLLAICDKDLLGKTIKDQNIEIELSKDFYGNEDCDEKKALELASRATIINATGNNIVSLLIDNNIVNGDCVMKINDVPHAQVIVVA
ncbi:DUF424 domain-containing protein [Candidatus Aenigmatarchaeota archaeon]